MSNEGKCKDRSPKYSPAGKVTHDNTLTMESLLKSIDEVESKPQPTYKYRPVDTSSSSKNFQGYYTQVRALISPEPKSVFQALKDELKETNFKSYWNRELGKVPDQVPGLPVGMDPTTTTFGSRTVFDGGVYEVFNPTKTPGEIIFESELGHELYRKSHSHYFPGERIFRNYDGPVFSPNKVWGKQTSCDPSGRLVRNVIQWFDQNKISTTSRRQAIKRFQSHHETGKALAPNGYLEILPKGFAFGIETEQDLEGVEATMKPREALEIRKKLAQSLQHLNVVRLKISKTHPPFSHLNFLANFEEEDSQSRGFLPRLAVYEIAALSGIELNKDLVDPILKMTGILQVDNTVDYIRFAKLINPQFQFPDLGKIVDFPADLLIFESTYQSLVKDLEKKEQTDKIRRAGKKQDDKGEPLVIRENIGHETDVHTLVRPSLFTQYGVSHRDMLKPRTKEFIKDIFGRIGVNIPDDVFTDLWKEGVSRDKTGSVCVETFRNILDEITSARLAQISLV